MRRIVVTGLVVATSIVSFAAGVDLALRYVEYEFSHRLDYRTAYWTKTLNDNVKVGEPRSDVQAWIDRNVRRPSGGDDFDAANRKFFIVVDEIQEPVPFPCSEWLLAAEITLDPDGSVTSRKITSSGECL